MILLSSHSPSVISTLQCEAVAGNGGSRYAPFKVDSGKNKTVETEGAIIMSLKGKIPPELKIHAVEDHQATRKGFTEIGRAHV